MATSGLQQGEDLHMIASVVAVVGWKPLGAAGQKTKDEQKEADNNWNRPAESKSEGR